MAELAKLGDVEFDCVSQEGTVLANKISENTIETGEEVADHISRMPASVSLVGIIVGEDAAKKYSELLKYRNEKTLLKYVGRVSLQNCEIQSFGSSRDKNIKNGYYFNIVIRQVKIASKVKVDIDTTKVTVPQSKKPTSGGKQSATTGGAKPSKTVIEEVKETYPEEKRTEKEQDQWVTDKLTGGF